MSIYYNRTLVNLLMDERIREARAVNGLGCCQLAVADQPKRSLFDLFRRQSPATCSC